MDVRNGHQRASAPLLVGLAVGGCASQRTQQGGHLEQLLDMLIFLNQLTSLLSAHQCSDYSRTSLV